MKEEVERKKMIEVIKPFVEECPSLKATIEVLHNEMDNNDIYDKQDFKIWDDEQMFMANLGLQWLDGNMSDEEFIKAISE